MFVYMCVLCHTHTHALSVGFSAICWCWKRWTKETRPTRGTCSSAFPSQAWLTLSHPSTMLLFWFFSVSALLSPIRFSLPVESFPSSLLWAVNPHLRLLPQLYFPFAESLPPRSPSPSPASPYCTVSLPQMNSLPSPSLPRQSQLYPKALLLKSLSAYRASSVHASSSSSLLLCLILTPFPCLTARLIFQSVSHWWSSFDSSLPVPILVLLFH